MGAAAAMRLVRPVLFIHDVGLDLFTYDMLT
jgi:hypothetical protein